MNEFDGTSTYDMQWERSIEHFFEYKDKQYNLAKLKLTKNATTGSAQDQRVCGAKGKIDSWDKIKKYLGKICDNELQTTALCEVEYVGTE